MNFHYRTNNPAFDPFSHFLEQKQILHKIWFCHAQLHIGFWHHSKILKKLMSEFQENAQTDEGQTEG